MKPMLSKSRFLAGLQCTDDGLIEHREYLCFEDKDPRVEFTETLIEALGENRKVMHF
jgi:hypothetical protein